MTPALLLQFALATGGNATAAPVPADASAPAPLADDQLFRRAHALAAAGQREDAIALYSELLARNPGHADALLARGRTHAWLRQWAQSEADLLAVTRARPTYADAWSALGDLYAWTDRPVEAADAYGRWQALRPQDAAPHLARARAYDRAGDVLAARADYEAAAAKGGPAVAPMAIPRSHNPEAVVPAGYRWSLRTEAGRTGFSGARADWDDYEIGLRRHFARGSLALEVLSTHRFGTHDRAWALDGYVDTWARAYANLRYQHAPGSDLFPGRAWRAELFQGVGEGWELSASVDSLRFDSSSTELYGLGVGRYVGNFYLRARSRYSTSSHDFGHHGLVRYYYAGNADEYVEVSAGNSRSEDRIGGGNEGSTSLGLAFVRHFTPALGMKLAAGHADDTPSETKGSVTVYYRW
jgi:YaiO family outer membrane protein